MGKMCYTNRTELEQWPQQKPMCNRHRDSRPRSALTIKDPIKDATVRLVNFLEVFIEINMRQIVPVAMTERQRNIINRHPDRASNGRPRMSRPICRQLGKQSNTSRSDPLPGTSTYGFEGMVALPDKLEIVRTTIHKRYKMLRPPILLNE